MNLPKSTKIRKDFNICGYLQEKKERNMLLSKVH